MKVATLVVLSLVFAQNSFAAYSAHCVRLSGDGFLKPNTFSADDTYLKLQQGQEIFVVKSATENGLASLCRGGTLVTEFTTVYIAEQVTPGAYVSEGHYLKNPKFYQFQRNYRTVTDGTAKGIR